MYTNEQLYGLLTKPAPELISRYDMINKPEPDELYHHGVKGMKWGVRRYQNEDGTLTAEGKNRRKEYYNSTEAFERNYDDLTREEREYAIKRRKDISEFARATKPKKQSGVVKAAEGGAKAVHGARQVMNDLGTIGAGLLATYAFFNTPQGRAIKRWVKTKIKKM